MSVIDLVALIAVALAAVYGLFRGIISQLMGIFGLIFALLFAGRLSPLMATWVKDQFGWSKFLSDKFSMFFMGVLIYVLFRIIGVFLGRFIGTSKELKSMNRVGGAFLGGIKGLIIVVIAFLFLTLLPLNWIKSWIPKLPQSLFYKIASRHNPMLDSNSLERMRKVRSLLNKPEKLEKMRKSPVTKKILEKHKVPGMFEDKRFIKVLEEGDYDTLHKNHDFEGVMNEDELATLLEKIEGESE